LLGLLAGALEDEIRGAPALPLCRHFDKLLLAWRSAETESLGTALWFGRKAHGSLLFPLYAS
jgi:hypothetical protein